MKHGWEKAAKKKLSGIVENFSAFGKDGELQIVGVAVVNHETGEAALIKLDSFSADIIGADMAQDILGDAQRQYSKALKAAGLHP